MKLISHITPVLQKLMSAEVIIGAAIVVLLAIFSRKIRGMGAKRLAMTAIMCALAAAGGAALRNIPGVQPTSFIVIICGVVFGAGPGLACGIVTAFIFDLLTIITTFTVWRMLLWGLMGLIAAAFARRGRLSLSIYGFVWGFVFGWILNTVFYFDGIYPFSWINYMTSCANSFVFDLSHAVCNTLLLAAFSGGAFKIIKKAAVPPPDASKTRPK